MGLLSDVFFLGGDTVGCFVPAPGVKKKLRVVGGEALRVSLLEDDADGRSFAWYLVLGR